MKVYALLIAMTWCVTVHGADAPATNAAPDTAEQNRMYMEAIWSQSHGQYAQAEVQLKQLVALQPDNPDLKHMLASVQAKLTAIQNDPLTLQKRRVATTMIPEVSFREAAAMDVFDFLRSESAKYSADKTEVDFVWLVPPATKLGPITLHLRNVSLEDVIRYVTKMADLDYRIDPHAVVIFKPEAAPTPAPNAKSE